MDRVYLHVFSPGMFLLVIKHLLDYFLKMLIVPHVCDKYGRWKVVVVFLWTFGGCFLGGVKIRRQIKRAGKFILSSVS